MHLEARQWGYYNSGYRGRCYSNWDCWGRWVACAVIVAVVLIVFFGASCFSARRRRRRGAQPMYGTAWMAPPPAGHGQAHWYGPGGSNAQHHNTQPHYEAPPPQYGEMQGYYGGHQQSGVEMQAPNNSYQPNLQRGGDTVYAPPPGPPPQKN